MAVDVVTPSFEPALSGGDDICDVIEDVLEDAAELVEEVTWEQALDHLEMLRQQAQQDPRWASFAHEMGMWANDQGNISFGVRPDSPHAEDAFAAEYGDAEHPPSPLIRMGMTGALAGMRHNMEEAFRSYGY